MAAPITALLPLLLGSCSGDARIHGAFSSRPFPSPYSNQHLGYAESTRAFPKEHFSIVPHNEHYCANGGVCLPPVLCAAAYLETLYDPSAPCHLAPGTPGVCCPPRKSPCEYLDIQPLCRVAIYARKQPSRAILWVTVTARGASHPRPIKNFLYCDGAVLEIQRLNDYCCYSRQGVSMNLPFSRGAVIAPRRFSR